MRAMRRACVAAGPLLLAATGAYAGSLTLYEGPDFDGRSIVANSDVSYVKRWGFSDSAASIAVTNGIWEACTDPYYKGSCVQLPPGNYRGLDVTLNAPVTSVRQVAQSDRVAVVPPPAVVVATPPPAIATVTAPVVVNPAPVVVSPQVVAPVQPVVVSPPAVVAVTPSTGRIMLYEYPNFGGVQASIDRGQAKDFDWANFNNPNHRATSIHVDSGNWIVCTEQSFTGECRVLGPGDYPTLSGALSVGVSSAEQVWRPEYGALTVYSR
jgi:hypothetical protein